MSYGSHSFGSPLQGGQGVSIDYYIKKKFTQKNSWKCHPWIDGGWKPWNPLQSCIENIGLECLISGQWIKVPSVRLRPGPSALGSRSSQWWPSTWTGNAQSLKLFLLQIPDNLAQFPVKIILPFCRKLGQYEYRVRSLRTLQSIYCSSVRLSSTIENVLSAEIRQCWMGSYCIRFY